MLLQVHDELVLEAPPEEADEVAALVKSAMEGVRKLEVPFLVDIGSGENWRTRSRAKTYLAADEHG